MNNFTVEYLRNNFSSSRREQIIETKNFGRPEPEITWTQISKVGVFCNIDRLELVMPRYAIKGGHVILKCDHSVRPEQLHKVEWRKGEDKIFQYIKGRKPPFKYYPTAGAILNKTHSSEKQMQLSNLDFSASGSYYCVVSMETPSIFTKDSDVKDLTIIEPQDRDPEISFKKSMYQLGELFEANCTTGMAKPPPYITWLINNEKVMDSLTKSFSNGLVHGHGYFETKSYSVKQLSMEVSDIHLDDDLNLTLTCMATIPGYVNNNEDYADFRQTTIKIEVVMTEPPAESASVEASSSMGLFNLNSIILIFVVFLVFS